MPRHAARSSLLGFFSIVSPRHSTTGMSSTLTWKRSSSAPADGSRSTSMLTYGKALRVRNCCRRSVPAEWLEPIRMTSPPWVAISPTRRRMNARMKISLNSASLWTRWRRCSLSMASTSPSSRTRARTTLAAPRSVLISPENWPGACTTINSSPERPGRTISTLPERTTSIVRWRSPGSARISPLRVRFLVPCGSRRAICAGVSRGKACAHRASMGLRATTSPPSVSTLMQAPCGECYHHETARLNRREALSFGTRPRNHESARPPLKLVEHVLRVLFEVRKLLDILALHQCRHEIGALEMHAGTRRGHLQLHADQSQLLDGAGGTHASVAHIGCGLAVPLRVRVVQSVLEHRRDAAVVFRGDEEVAVELGDLLLPALRHLVLRGRPHIGRDLVEERHRVVAQVEELHAHVGSGRGDLMDPFRRLLAEAAHTCGADDDRDLGFGHG